ncbi:DUF6653 family protein [Coralliovum pocilloporae]|uniref:DUF6653 family protein n=1 Tax=Coralliovum pocilloporae TaxID=3066369 RepID=UPI003306AD3A
MLSKQNWERHANPWSVWTRVATLPFFALILWSPHWIGWWSLPLIALLAFWLWLNPRLFPPPLSLDSWASRVTLGERCWLALDAQALPQQHRTPLKLLNGVMGLGVFLLLLGLAIGHGWLFSLGNILVFLGKLWFCDRMVWLYLDLRNQGRLPDGLL